MAEPQPVCLSCWTTIFQGSRFATRPTIHVSQCVVCGADTDAGILLPDRDEYEPGLFWAGR